MKNKKEIKKIAKPFVKWAGGKTQLLAELSRTIPNNIKQIEFTYIEPFVGAVQFCFGFYKNIRI